MADNRDWSERGGIIGRGVLVDFASWAALNGVEVNPATRQVITLDVIKQILTEENVVLKRGDILMVRTGLIQAYNECKNNGAKNSLMRSSHTIGVEASEEMVQWLWNNHLAAVTGDAVAFEAQPFAKEYGKWKWDLERSD